MAEEREREKLRKRERTSERTSERGWYHTDQRLLNALPEHLAEDAGAARDAARVHQLYQVVEAGVQITDDVNHDCNTQNENEKRENGPPKTGCISEGRIG